MTFTEKITFEDMEKYGYKWNGMVPLNEKAALSLFEESPIYLLYQDNTESLADSIMDIKTHAEKEGIFGIEKEDVLKIPFKNYCTLKNVEPVKEGLHLLTSPFEYLSAIEYELIDSAKEFLLNNAIEGHWWETNTPGLSGVVIQGHCYATDYSGVAGCYWQDNGNASSWWEPTASLATLEQSNHIAHSHTHYEFDFDVNSVLSKKEHQQDTDTFEEQDFDFDLE